MVVMAQRQSAAKHQTMSTNWYIEHNGKPHGPLTSAQLKQLAGAGKINRETKVRMNDDGRWSLAAKIKGLFPETEFVVVPNRALATAPPPIQEVAPQRPTVIIQHAPAPQTKPCPFCGEEIAMTAIKCRHCNEFLDGRPRESSIPIPHPVMQPMMMAQPAINVTQVTNVGHSGHPHARFSPLVAALLSFIIPGLGQLYKGQPINGLVWFVIVVIGYIAFIIPGIVLHLCCIAGAAMGNPYR